MNWNKIWMPLLGTCEWLGLNIGFWVSMAVVVIIVTINIKTDICGRRSVRNGKRQNLLTKNKLVGSV